MIRKWNPADISAILKIEETSFPIPLNEGQLKREMENPQAVYFVAEENDSVVGYGGFWSVADEAQVMNIAVLPAVRGRGFGIEIVEEMTREAKSLGLSFMSLEVRASNVAAIRLYEKFGFSSIGERKKYYRDNGETAVLMEKNLGE